MEKGSNNTYIDNNGEKYGCKIDSPKYCQCKAMSPYIDFTKILSINCSFKKSNSWKILLEKSKSPYITKETKTFGFPLTNKGFIGTMDGLENKILTQCVIENIIDKEKNYTNCWDSEITVDFSKDPLGELIIDLKYNHTLSLERKKL